MPANNRRVDILRLRMDIQSHFKQNQVMAGKVRELVRLVIDGINDNYDGATTMEEVCRLQGRKKALQDIYEMVGGTQ